MRSSYRVLYYPLQLLVYLLIIYGLFSLSRLVFYCANHASFPSVSSLELIKIFTIGLRFDTSAIVYVNLLFILSFILPLPFRQSKAYRGVQLFLFLLFNFLALLLELIDTGFFGYSFKRSASGDLQMIANSFQLTPQYLLDYWYLLFLLLFAVWGMYKLYQKCSLSPPSQPASFWTQVLVFLGCVPIVILAARGGWQLRPLSPISSTDYIQDIRLAPVVSNTTLNIIFSFQQRHLQVPHYFPPNQLDQRYPIELGQVSNDSMQGKNVVILVLESFGKEQVGYFKPDQKSYTPFFDSLLAQSWRPEMGLANGLRSTQGIAAISIGLPALMEDPIMFSAYQNNSFSGLADCLKKKGYYTSFFHGCNPGSMELERFAQISHFDQFYDKTEYGNEADYDGNWGIWDRPFFQFFAQTLDTYTTPFLSVFFSLTSHHPYAVEESFAQQYPDLDPVKRSYLYTDQALREFFEVAQKKPWYPNTLFVITADHVGPSKDPDNFLRYNRYQIPIGIFDPAKRKNIPTQQLMTQIDILPSVLDYLDYNEPYVSFGRSVFDTLSPRYFAGFSESLYHLMDDQFLLLFDRQESTGLYRYHEDPKLENNLLKQENADRIRLEEQLKAMIQQHDTRMIRNKWGAF